MNFTLETLYIRRVQWGDEKDLLKGKITFKDKEGDNEFTFELDTERTKKYIDLIKEEVISSASELADKLNESLKDD